MRLLRIFTVLLRVFDKALIWRYWEWVSMHPSLTSPSTKRIIMWVIIIEALSLLNTTNYNLFFINTIMKATMTIGPWPLSTENKDRCVVNLNSAFLWKWKKIIRWRSEVLYQLLFKKTPIGYKHLGHVSEPSIPDTLHGQKHWDTWPLHQQGL